MYNSDNSHYLSGGSGHSDINPWKEESKVTSASKNYLDPAKGSSKAKSNEKSCTGSADVGINPQDMIEE